MVKAGQYYSLKVVKKVDFGCYLDANGDEILLPKRFVPAGVKEGDELTVFVYHDSEDRVIATTQKPFAIVGEMALMEVVHKTNHGAFMSWGIMKDLFVPTSQQISKMQIGGHYLVMLYLDEMTGRVAATEKIQRYLTNDDLTVKENEEVNLLAYYPSEIGFNVIINNKHIGLMHQSDIFQKINIGDKLKGYVKTIRPDNKIDVKLGIKGYERVNNETDKVLTLLRQNGGFLPFNDKSSPEDIYENFGVSKKTFKMTIGSLYKEKKIDITTAGILLTDGD